jgi:hypothetical protein
MAWLRILKRRQACNLNVALLGINLTANMVSEVAKPKHAY